MLRNIINYFKEHKIAILILLLVLGVFLLIKSLTQKTSEPIVTPQITPNQKNRADFKSVYPGIDIQDKLNEQLGNPINTKEENGKKVSEYESTSQYRHNEAVVQDEKVVFIKEIVTAKDNKKSDVIIDEFGEPPYKLYENLPNSTFSLFAYPDNGIAYLGHEDGTLLEIWYFSPIEINQFIQKWAQNYSFERSSVQAE